MIKSRHITTNRNNLNKVLKRYLKELENYEILFITESSFTERGLLDITEQKIHYTFFYKEK